MPVSQDMIYAAAALTCAGLAAVCDVRERRIPNWLTGPALLVGLLLHLALGGPAQAGWALLAALIAGGIFMVFYIAGGMGAGDVKLIAALAALTGMQDVKVLLLATVITGAVFAIAMATWRGALRKTAGNVLVLVAHHRSNGLEAHPELNVANKSTLRLPYALPIAVGCAIAVGSHVIAGVAR